MLSYTSPVPHILIHLVCMCWCYEATKPAYLMYQKLHVYLTSPHILLYNQPDRERFTRLPD